jgi:hypothetical protein
MGLMEDIVAALNSVGRIVRHDIIPPGHSIPYSAGERSLENVDIWVAPKIDLAIPAVLYCDSGELYLGSATGVLTQPQREEIANFYRSVLGALPPGCIDRPFVKEKNGLFRMGFMLYETPVDARATRHTTIFPVHREEFARIDPFWL